jgi:hypothetical protein
VSNYAIRPTVGGCRRVASVARDAESASGNRERVILVHGILSTKSVYFWAAYSLLRVSSGFRGSPGASQGRRLGLLTGSFEVSKAA